MPDSTEFILCRLRHRHGLCGTCQKKDASINAFGGDVHALHLERHSIGAMLRIDLEFDSKVQSLRKKSLPALGKQFRLGRIVFLHEKMLAIEGNGQHFVALRPIASHERT